MDIINSIDKLLPIVAANVTRYRKELALTQEDLAFKADIDRTYIGYIENGKQNVSLEKLCEIAKALNVRVRDLIDF